MGIGAEISTLRRGGSGGGAPAATGDDEDEPEEEAEVELYILSNWAVPCLVALKVSMLTGSPPKIAPDMTRATASDLESLNSMRAQLAEESMKIDCMGPQKAKNLLSSGSSTEWDRLETKISFGSLYRNVDVAGGVG
jgi:hypothetical protein